MDKRAPNFTADERQKIVDLEHKYHHIIENNQTDICTNKEKEIAWKKIESEFNASSHICRMSQQLVVVLFLSSAESTKYISCCTMLGSIAFLI